MAAQAKLVVLMEVRSTIGRGVEGDPVREVVEWFTPDGVRVSHRDRYLDDEVRKLNNSVSLVRGHDPETFLNVPAILIRQLNEDWH